MEDSAEADLDSLSLAIGTILAWLEGAGVTFLSWEVGTTPSYEIDANQTDEMLETRADLGALFRRFSEEADAALGREEAGHPLSGQPGKLG
jgi:hypothetical protein